MKRRHLRIIVKEIQAQQRIKAEKQVCVRVLNPGIDVDQIDVFASVSPPPCGRNVHGRSGSNVPTGVPSRSWSEMISVWIMMCNVYEGEKRREDLQWIWMEKMKILGIAFLSSQEDSRSPSKKNEAAAAAYVLRRDLSHNSQCPWATAMHSKWSYNFYMCGWHGSSQMHASLACHEPVLKIFPPFWRRFLVCAKTSLRRGPSAAGSIKWCTPQS